jgi:hypothetical protein
MEKNIASISVFLELGKWDLYSLNRKIQSIYEKNSTYPARANDWANSLLKTPFHFEFRLSPIPNNCIRIRLSSFDCVTFIYNIIALAGAQNIEDYVRRLRDIRYKNANLTSSVSNDPHSGNFFDYACEAFLFQGIDNEMLVDITEDIISHNHLASFNTYLAPMQRPDMFDPNNLQLIEPRYEGRELVTQLIATEKIKYIDKNKLCDGDIILFTRAEISGDTASQPYLVNHCALVHLQPDKISLIHSNKNYWANLQEYTGRTSSNSSVSHVTPEHLGVWYAGEYLGDEYVFDKDGVRYFGYDKYKKRSLEEYSGEFRAIKILRIVG